MIGQRIKQARVVAAMTQDEVVAALDALGHPLTKAGLSKCERGGSVPKPTTLRALGRVLRVPADFFFEEPRATIEVEWLPPRDQGRVRHGALCLHGRVPSHGDRGHAPDERDRGARERDARGVVRDRVAGAVGEWLRAVVGPGA